MPLKIETVTWDGYGSQLGMHESDILVSLNGIDLDSDEMLNGVSGALVIEREGRRCTLHIDGSSYGITVTPVIPEKQDAFTPIESAFAAQRRKVVVTTSVSVEGRQVHQQLGIVGGQCIFGANFLGEILGEIRDVVGGRSGRQQKLLREAREVAIDEMLDQAILKGANAIIGVQIQHAEIGKSSMLMVTAAGTAVRVEDDPSLEENIEVIKFIPRGTRSTGNVVKYCNKCRAMNTGEAFTCFRCGEKLNL